jgi:hypothetical protein
MEFWPGMDSRGASGGAVMPAFLALNKSPTKSCVISKTDPPSSVIIQTLATVFSLSLSLSLSLPDARAAIPAGTAPRPHPCAPSQRRGRPPAGNPAHAAVPVTGPPRHHRRPRKCADARKTGEKPHKTLPNFP